MMYHSLCLLHMNFSVYYPLWGDLVKTATSAFFLFISILQVSTTENARG